MKQLCIIFAISTSALLVACNDSGTKDSVEIADSTNEARDTTGLTGRADSVSGMGVNDNVAEFAVDAANGGMMEVQLGEYAAKNAVNKDVKDFGSMMVQDHTKASNELKSIASSKNIALPASVGEDKAKTIEDMKKKTGADFDKNYMNMMVDDHQKDIDEFQDIADNSNDAEMKAFAAKTLPTLKLHLEKAKAIVKAHNF